MSTINYYTVACEDYLYFKGGLELNLYNNTAVMAAQVVEKYLKYLVQEFCVNHSESETVLKTHNLPKLEKVPRESGINLNIDVRDLHMLKNYYFDAKYPGDNHIRVSKREAEACVEIVEYIRDKVIEYITSQGYCAKCGLKLLSTGICSSTYCE